MGRTPIRAKRVLDAYAELKITFTFAFRNSQATAFSYIFSKKPGPSSLATRKQQPMINPVSGSWRAMATSPSHTCRHTQRRFRRGWG